MCFLIACLTAFARSEVEVRPTPRTVEIFLKGKRIAAHLRASGNYRHTTVPEHMLSSHRRYADWTVERIRRAAASIGLATAALCEPILERWPHLSRASALKCLNLAVSLAPHLCAAILDVICPYRDVGCKPEGNGSKPAQRENEVSQD